MKGLNPLIPPLPHPHQNCMENSFVGVVLTDSCVPNNCFPQIIVFKVPNPPILFQPPIINFVISKSMFQSFDSIFIKTYTKFLSKIKKLIKSYEQTKRSTILRLRKHLVCSYMCICVM